MVVAALASACAHPDALRPPNTSPAVESIDPSARAESGAPTFASDSQRAGASPGTTWEGITSNAPPSNTPDAPPPDAVTVGLTSLGGTASPARPATPAMTGSP